MHNYRKKLCSVICAVALLLSCAVPGLQGIAADVLSGTRDSMPQADIYGLRNLITLADAVDVSQSTAAQSDIDAFQADLAHAKEVEQNAGASAAEIDSAYNSLAETYNILSPIINPTEVLIIRSGAGLVYYDQISVGLLEDYRNVSQQYEVLPQPYDTLIRSVRWSSSNSNVSISPDGVVTVLDNSAAYSQINVEVTTYDGRVITNNIPLYVCFAKVHVTGITLEAESIIGYVGETRKLSYSIFPSGVLTANIQDVIWSLNISDEVTLDADGTLHFNKASGPDIPCAVVRATTVDGGKSADCWIYTDYNRKALQAKINEAGQLDETLYTAESWQQLGPVLAQAIAVNDKDFYSISSQQEIDNATEALTNAMQALEPLATIESIVITRDGSPAAEFNSIKVGTFGSYTNQSLSLGFTVTPSDAAYQSLTWSSSDPKMNVDQNGKVSPATNSAVAAEITVTVTDYNGREFSDSVYVAFTKTPVTGVSLDQSSLSMITGETASLSCTIDPQGTLGVGAAAVKNVIWKSSDPYVALVNDEGTVTAVDGGTATISCITIDGGYTATCYVNVTVDKTALWRLLSNARGISGSEYTTASFAALQNAIQAGEAVYNDVSAKVSEVDEAYESLYDAINNLQIRPADYMALYQAISAYEALDPDMYSSESYAAVQQAVSNVVFDLPYTEQNRVDAMTQAIINAISELEVRRADYTAVNAAVDAFNALFALQYTPESYAAVQQAVSNVVYDLPYTEQSRVDAMAEAINTAISQLVEGPADYSAVNAAVDAFNALSALRYTPDSYAAVQQAVNNVVYGLMYSEQARVYAMAESINSAIALLVVRPEVQLTPSEGSSAVVDETNHLVYGILPGTDDILSLFSVTNGSAAFTPAANGNGTGSTLTLTDNYGDTVGTYTLVLFGDVNGDAWYDGTDAFLVNLVVAGMVSADALTDAQQMAADCNHDGTIDSDDVFLLEQAGIMLAQVDQSFPADENDSGSNFLSYSALIDQSPEIDEPAADEQPAQTETNGRQIVLDLFKRLVNFITMIFSIVVLPK